MLTNAGSKIVDYSGKKPGEGQTKFHPEIIETFLSLNEITIYYRVTLNLGYGNDFKVHIGDNIV